MREPVDLRFQIQVMRPVRGVGYEPVDMALFQGCRIAVWEVEGGSPNLKEADQVGLVRVQPGEAEAVISYQWHGPQQLFVRARGVGYHPFESRMDATPVGAELRVTLIIDEIMEKERNYHGFGDELVWTVFPTGDSS